MKDHFLAYQTYATLNVLQYGSLSHVGLAPSYQLSIHIFQ